jgi:hypothetical protein
MANGTVTPIEMLGVNPVELAHRLRQIRLDGLKHQMKVIGHQAKTMHDAVVAFAHQGNYPKPCYAICIVFKNQAAVIAARGDVIERAGKL